MIVKVEVRVYPTTSLSHAPSHSEHDL